MNFSLEHPVLQTLAWTLLHFLWQGTLLGLTAKVGLWLLRTRSPQARYLFGCAVLAAMAVAPVATFLILQPGPAMAVGTALIESAGRVGPASTLAAAWEASIPSWTWEITRTLKPLLPWAVGIWVTGVALLSLRLVGGWFWLIRLRTRLAEPAGACWQMTLNTLARRMKVHQDVRIFRSWAVDTPMVVGWVKPLVLVPASALTGLPPEALEAILAHELAHVRRHDYLVNLLQSVLEVGLFYHPAVWWVSTQVRQERELCCDDAAVALCGDPVLYARALTALEGLRGDVLPETRLAPAANGGTLMTRIQRLLSPTLPPSPTRRAGILAALAVTALGAGTVFRLQDAPKKPEVTSDRAEAKKTQKNIQINEDGSRLRINTKGEVKIRPDVKTDLNLAEGATFEISETEKDTVRKFRATKEKGAETRTFTVNGKDAPVDKAWLDQRLERIQKLEARTAEAREKATAGAGKAGDLEEKVRRVEVRVRKIEKDGAEIIEDIEVTPGTQGGRGQKHIILKQLDGLGPLKIQELSEHSKGKVIIMKGSGSKVLELEGHPGQGEEKVFVFKGSDGKTTTIDVEKITKDAHERAKELQHQAQDLAGVHNRVLVIKPNLDFDFDEGSGVESREQSKVPRKVDTRKEMEILRREIEKLQQRLNHIQERLQAEGAPPPPPPPKPPKAPKASSPKPAVPAPPPPPPPPGSVK